eukprot:764110-Hanusia_phi.AAC.1
MARAGSGEEGEDGRRTGRKEGGDRGTFFVTAPARSACQYGRDKVGDRAGRRRSRRVRSLLSEGGLWLTIIVLSFLAHGQVCYGGRASIVRFLVAVGDSTMRRLRSSTNSNPNPKVILVCLYVMNDRSKDFVPFRDREDLDQDMKEFLVVFTSNSLPLADCSQGMVERKRNEFRGKRSTGLQGGAGAESVTAESS